MSTLRPRLSIFESPPVTSDPSFRAHQGLSPAETAPPLEQLDERILPIKSLRAASQPLAPGSGDARSQSARARGDVLDEEPQIDHRASEQKEALTTKEYRRAVRNDRSATPPQTPGSREERTTAPPKIAGNGEGRAMTAEKSETPSGRESPSQHAPSISSPGKPVFAKSIKPEPRDFVPRKIIEITAASSRVPDRAPPPARAFHPASLRVPSLRPRVPSEQPRVPAEPPSINVTIGRVEVRATLPPAVSKTPRSSASVVSLDEYLRRRSGGDRR
jgi:hypothetical protein